MRFALMLGMLLAVVNFTHADEAANKKLAESLIGKYKMTGGERNGEKAPPQFLKDMAAEFTKDKFTLNFGGTKMESTFVVDASKKPMTIDFTPIDTKKDRLKVEAIISVEKDIVKICWIEADDAKGYPKDFTTTKENKYMIFIMEKTK